MANDTHSVSRRAFLQYLGVALTLPSCGGADPVVTIASTTGPLTVTLKDTLRVLRPDDMLALEIALGDMQVTSEGITTVGPGDGVILLGFGPQHVFEEAIADASPPPTLPSSVGARLSGPSRLAFRVPKGTVIASDLGALLTQCLLSAQNVNAGAALAPAGSPPVPPMPADAEEMLEILLASQRERSSGIDTTPLMDGAPGTRMPAEPGPFETSVEMPYRLALSPHEKAPWSFLPSAGARRPELWHASLAPNDASARSVRALHTYDASSDLDPFPHAPMKAAHRASIVQQSSNSARPRPPLPIRVKRMILSALGGWLDADVSFLEAGVPDDGDVIAWTHVATLGRDQFVRVVTLGYFFPWSAYAAFVEITERKTGYPPNPTDNRAALWKRYDVVPLEPVRLYAGEHQFFADGRRLPFRAVAIKNKRFSVDPPANQDLFWLTKDGRHLYLEMEATDLTGNLIRFETPALFYSGRDPGMRGQAKQIFETTSIGGELACVSRIAPQRLGFAPMKKADDTVYEARRLQFAAALHEPLPSGHVPATEIDPRASQSLTKPRRTFIPYVAEADIAVPSIQQLTGSPAASTFKAHGDYVSKGFAAGEILLERTGQALTAAFSAGSDKTGGFIAPDLSVQGLSRLVGPVSGTSTADLATLAGGVVDTRFFDALAGAKIFGVIPLSKLFLGANPTQSLEKLAPKFVTDALDVAASFLSMAKQLEKIARDAHARVSQLPSNAQYLDPIKTRALLVADKVVAILPSVAAADIDKLVSADGKSGQIPELLQTIDLLIGDLNVFFRVPSLNGLAESELRALMRKVEEVRGHIADAKAFRDRIQSFLKAAEGAKDLTTRIDWRPPLQNVTFGPFTDIFVPKKTDGLLLHAEVRAKKVGSRPAGIDLVCSLENFEVNLLGTGMPFVTLAFTKLQFLLMAGKKPDVDVVFKGLTFKGPLAFVEALRSIIPLDGFSDPPALKVDASGIRASFTQSLPNLAVGIFSLENMKLAAELHVPFIGGSMSLSFQFCKRESPFRLTVGAIGGGGYFGMTVGMAGIVLIEAVLQFGACISMSFAVASGSVSVMGGISLRYTMVPKQEIQLTGFFRVRGEVEVLGLISAAIELYLALTYQGGGDATYIEGEAKLKIEISISFFSKSVEIGCKRRFCAKNSDPTFLETMGHDDKFRPWDEYCAAFAA